MVSQLYSETARRYCVDDLPGASLPGARLQKILDYLQCGRPVTLLSLGFLRKQGLELLYRLAIGELPYDNFLELALVERSLRIEMAIAAKCEEQARKAAKQAEAQTRESAMFAKMQAAREAKERDPKYIAKIKNQQLRYKYGIGGYIEPPCFDRLMDILRCVNAKKRLPQEDVVWLCSVGENYFSEELQVAYHRLEAEFLLVSLKKRIIHGTWLMLVAIIVSALALKKPIPYWPPFVLTSKNHPSSSQHFAQHMAGLCVI